MTKSYLVYKDKIRTILWIYVQVCSVSQSLGVREASIKNFFSWRKLQDKISMKGTQELKYTGCQGIWGLE